MGNREHTAQWARIAWRNIARQPKRSALLAGAIGFSVLVITLVNGYTAGLVGAVRENFTQSFGGHIYVTGSIVEPGVDGTRQIEILRDGATLDEAIAASEIPVVEVNRRSATTGTLIYTTNELFQTAEGVDFAREARFRSAQTLVEGSWDEMNLPGSILLSSTLVEQLDVAYGETLLFSLSTVTGQRNVVELTVRGVVAAMPGLGITSAYVGLADLNAALGLEPGDYQTANLYLDEDSAASEDIEAATRRLETALAARATVATGPEEEGNDLPGGPMALLGRLMGATGGTTTVDEPWEGTRFEVSNLNETTEDLQTVVDTLNAVAFAIFFVLLAITAVGITNSYRMVMIERTQEIGTMRSIGVKRRAIRAIFTFEALFIAVIGASTGVAIAFLVTTVVGLFEIGAGTALAAFLVRGRLVAHISAGLVARNVVVMLAMTVWAVSAPARAASRIQPAQALRATY